MKCCTMAGKEEQLEMFFTPLKSEPRKKKRTYIAHIDVGSFHFLGRSTDEKMAAAIEAADTTDAAARASDCFCGS